MDQLRDQKIQLRWDCLRLAVSLAQRGVNHSVGEAASLRAPILLEQTSDIVATAAEFYGFAIVGKAATPQIESKLKASERMVEHLKGDRNRLEMKNEFLAKFLKKRRKAPVRKK